MNLREPEARRAAAGMPCAGVGKPIRFWLINAGISLSALVFAACSGGDASPIRPASSRAAQISQLWWIFFGIATPIFVIVVALLLYGAWRRPGPAEAEGRHAVGTAMIWVGGVTVPLLALGAVLGFSVRDLARLGGGRPQLTIEVIGHQWWWEFRYPQQSFISANEIHIPTGRQVELRITSDDVIHDFWVPRLQGKIDAIPGETNTLTLQTDTAGTYRGECLVYCGLQHANMNFIVVADAPSQFDAWLAGQQTTPAAPTAAQLAKGQQVFSGAACVYCHAVKGTNASARVGPDLSHFGSRRQIGAGVLPNNAGALAGWIINPQTAKPGVHMPPEAFSGADLDSLVAYLESLK